MARIKLLLVLWLCMLFSSGLAQKDKNNDKNIDREDEPQVDEDEETASPTIPPSFRPAPLPTTAPTSRPSITPSTPPSLSFTPPKAPVATQVALPEMEIAFRVTEGPVIAQNLENDIIIFVKDVVVSNAKILGDLDRVELAVSVSADGRRRLEEKLKATLEGSAYFYGDVFPSTDRLSEVLTAYFANWGDADLEDYLTNGEVQVQGVEVSIDGELVQSLSPDNVDPDRIIPSETGGNDNGGVSTGLIIGLVAGCLVLLSALALVYVQRRKGNKGSKKYNSTPMSSPTRRSRSTGSPPADIDPEEFEVDAQSFSGISMDDGSLYTAGTPNSKEYYPPNYQDSATEYDPIRLDKVISGARDFVATHEGDDQASFPFYDADSIESVDFIPQVTDTGSISSDVMYI
jgi:hypothetical protein